MAVVAQNLDIAALLDIQLASASNSAIPRIAVIGWRISWRHMLDRNSDLACDAANAASRAATSSRSVFLSAVISRPYAATQVALPAASRMGKY